MRSVSNVRRTEATRKMRIRRIVYSLPDSDWFQGLWLVLLVVSAIGVGQEASIVNTVILAIVILIPLSIEVDNVD